MIFHFAVSEFIPEDPSGAICDDTGESTAHGLGGRSWICEPSENGELVAILMSSHLLFISSEDNRVISSHQLPAEMQSCPQYRRIYWSSDSKLVFVLEASGFRMGVFCVFPTLANEEQDQASSPILGYVDLRVHSSKQARPCIFVNVDSTDFGKAANLLCVYDDGRAIRLRVSLVPSTTSTVLQAVAEQACAPLRSKRVVESCTLLHASTRPLLALVGYVPYQGLQHGPFSNCLHLLKLPLCRLNSPLAVPC